MPKKKKKEPSKAIWGMKSTNFQQRVEETRKHFL